ncbi:terminase small subunit [Caulobacter sp. NIBR2454]|uniref:terminase small subunit n=1 Tax=Caulobacter sp. NIBR2454 TaxID=3015996 RepID=UPI0022B7422D|nr:terminase small subunit [Caulobacter sp. NIBR2454]
MALNEKHLRFVEEYLVDLNATQAAIRAGYSPKTAYSQGQRLLKYAEVAAAVAKAQEERAERTKVTADRVLTELAKIGFSDIRRAMKWGSRFVERPEDDTPEGERLEEQSHGGALKRRKAGDDGSDAFYVTTVEMRDSSELDDDTAAAISEVSQTKEGVRLKLHDKRAALVDIGKHLGMFTDKVEHSGGLKIEIDPLQSVMDEVSGAGRPKPGG